MLTTTLPRLKCLACAGPLDFSPPPQSPHLVDVRSGSLACKTCRASYLILAGIPLLVEDAHDYLLTHVKGISKIVQDSEIPTEFQDDFLEAKSQLEAEHIEEDLEAERVNALYLINHYLKADSHSLWWKPSTGDGSPLIDELIRTHWDHGPFSKIKEWVSELTKAGNFKAVVELGCGVGGLYAVLKPHVDFYLGVDSSFASIALARHLLLGAPYPGSLHIPEDLIQGDYSSEIKIPAISYDGRADFVVMDFENPALANGWDLTVSLNMIDMLNQPENLPRLQADLLVKNGVAIHSCPYVWHQTVAKQLREKLPSEIRNDSARAVEWLYQEAGLEIEKSVKHQPWLFYKHFRQLEIYSTHLFTARKKK
jgi:SAM-dependent methyltransferase